MATIYGRKHTIRRGYLLVPQEMTGHGGKVYTVDLEYQVFDGETGAPTQDTRTIEGELHGQRLIVGDPHRDTRLYEYTVDARPTSESEDYWHGYQAALGDRQWHREGSSKKYYANTLAWWDGYNQGHRDKRDPGAGYTPNAARRLTRLAPGEHLETRHVLAGAYRGRDISERALLTHSILVDGVHPDGTELRVLCGQPLEHMADAYSHPDMIDEAPTCPRCLLRWEKLQERHLEDLNAEMRYGARHQKNPRKSPTIQEGAFGDRAERARGTSGRFQSSTACDFCGRSCAGGHMSDTRVCGNSDGPGFFLCARASCRRARDKYEADHGIDALAERYAEQRSKNDAVTREPRYAKPKPLGTRFQIRFSNTREGAIEFANSHGHEMSPWEGNRSYCLRCGQDMHIAEGHASGPAWYRGSQCELAPNVRAREHSGRFDHDDMGLLCECSHTLGKHGVGTGKPGARRVCQHGTDGLDDPCDCENFRRARTQTANSGYYVWVLRPDGAPTDEGPYGPHPLETAEQVARVAATKGIHDRSVTRGTDPHSPSFEIMRRYRRGTGERII